MTVYDPSEILTRKQVQNDKKTKLKRTVLFPMLSACGLFLSLLPAVAADSANSPVSFMDVLSLITDRNAPVQSYSAESSVNFLHKIDSSSLGKVNLLIIHGGCWSNDYGVDHIMPMARALSLAGYSVWAPEYRRIGDKDGGWPNTVLDIKMAIQHVNEVTDASPLLIGHSAGGYLALKVAEDHSLPVLGVLALAPITDLVSYGAEAGSCQSMVSKFLGEDTYEPTEKYREASITPSSINVPVEIIIGSADPIVGLDQVTTFSASQVTIVANAGHFDLIHPRTGAFETVKARLTRLVQGNEVSEKINANSSGRLGSGVKKENHAPHITYWGKTAGKIVGTGTL